MKAARILLYEGSPEILQEQFQKRTVKGHRVVRLKGDEKFTITEYQMTGNIEFLIEALKTEVDMFELRDAEALFIAHLGETTTPPGE